jgi:hypothetical protein
VTTGGAAGKPPSTTPTDVPDASTPDAGNSSHPGASDGGHQDVCIPNDCGGCGTLSAAPGAACGTCGKYVCASNKASVSCNDPGTTNSCPTWCTSHPAPSGVAASDYQCVDFDNGLPPTSTWTQSVTGTAQLSRSTARASSSPDSLFVGVSSGTEDTANLSFSAVGSAPVKTISVSVAINPVHVILASVPPSGAIDLFCMETGSNATCLSYTVNGVGPVGAGGYTGFYVYSAYNGNSVVLGGCSMASLTDSIWSTVEIDVTPATGAVQVSVNGTVVASPATQPSCGGKFLADTVAKITVGPAAYGPPAFGWSGYMDNVQATIGR